MQYGADLQIRPGIYLPNPDKPEWKIKNGKWKICPM